MVDAPQARQAAREGAAADAVTRRRGLRGAGAERERRGRLPQTQGWRRGELTARRPDARETLVAREAISTGLRSDRRARYGILVCGATRRVWAIRYRNVWTPAQQPAAVVFSLYDVRYALLLARAGVRHSADRGSPRGSATASAPAATRSPTPSSRVYAHATGESRQPALDELATLIADADPDATSVRMSLSDPQSKITPWRCPRAASIETGTSRDAGACGAQRPATDRKKVTAK